MDFKRKIIGRVVKTVVNVSRGKNFEHFSIKTSNSTSFWKFEWNIFRMLRKNFDSVVKTEITCPQKLNWRKKKKISEVFGSFEQKNSMFGQKKLRVQQTEIYESSESVWENDFEGKIKSFIVTSSAKFRAELSKLQRITL